MRAFTLIELLIVVAIIAILAAIAVPNFLEAQTRAKVSRTLADMRAISTGIEAFRIDQNLYPVGSDSPAKVPQQVVDDVTSQAGGYDYYTFSTRANTYGGRDFDYLGENTGGAIWFGLTTPISYFSSSLADPFITGGRVTYAYREARGGQSGSGWILTSVGPDTDIATNWRGGGTTEPAPSNPFASGSPVAAAFDSAAAEISPNEGRHGDISERAIQADANGYGLGELQTALALLSYDPTNGTVSDGDLWRIGPGGGSSQR